MGDFFCGIYCNTRIKGWISYDIVYNRVDYGYSFDYFGEIAIYKAILSLPICTSKQKVVRLKITINKFREFDESQCNYIKVRERIHNSFFKFGIN